MPAPTSRSSRKQFKKFNKKMQVGRSDRYIRHRLLRVGYDEDQVKKILSRLSKEERQKLANEIMKKVPIDEDDTIITPDFDEIEPINDGTYDILTNELKKINEILRKRGVDIKGGLKKRLED